MRPELCAGTQDDDRQPPVWTEKKSPAAADDDCMRSDTDVTTSADFADVDSLTDEIFILLAFCHLHV